MKETAPVAKQPKGFKGNQDKVPDKNKTTETRVRKTKTPKGFGKMQGR